MILLYPWYNVVLIYITRRLKVRKFHFLEVFHYPLKRKHRNNVLSLFAMRHFWVRYLFIFLISGWAVFPKGRCSPILSFGVVMTSVQTFSEVSSLDVTR